MAMTGPVYLVCSPCLAGHHDADCPGPDHCACRQCWDPATLTEWRAEMAAALGLTPEEALDVDAAHVVIWHNLRHEHDDA